MKYRLLKTWMLSIILMLSIGMITTLYGQGNTGDGGLYPDDFERVGMAGFQFLKIQTEARMAALAGIRTVLSHGNAASSLSNPASIADVENLGFSFTQMNYIADVKYFSGSIVKSVGNWGTFGLNFIHLDYGDITRTYWGTDAQNNAIPVVDGVFSGGDIAVGLSYARQISERLQLGGTFRYISETLDSRENVSTNSFSFDIGTVYYTGLGSLRLAMLGSNFGPDAEFVDFNDRWGIPPVEVRMPVVFSVGAAYDFFDGDDSFHLLTLAGEFVHPNDGPEKIHTAAEYTLMDLLILRGGYRFNYDEDGLSLGAGIKVGIGDKHIVEIDYAFMDFGVLETRHMFTLVYNME